VWGQPCVFFHTECYREKIVLPLGGVTGGTMSHEGTLTMDHGRSYLANKRWRYESSDRTVKTGLLDEME
jgi:hypothetical protein